MREIVRRLEAGRVVCLFPEAGIRPGAESVIHGRPFRAVPGRISLFTGVPVWPWVLMDTGRPAG